MRWFSVQVDQVCEVAFAKLESLGLVRGSSLREKGSTVVLLHFNDHRAETTIKQALEKHGLANCVVVGFENSSKLKASAVWQKLQDAKSGEDYVEWTRESKAMSPADYAIVPCVECGKLQCEVARLTEENKRLQKKCEALESKEPKATKKRKADEDEEKISAPGESDVSIKQLMANVSVVAPVRTQNWIYPFIAEHVAKEHKLALKRWDYPMFDYKHLPTVEKYALIAVNFCLLGRAPAEHRLDMQTRQHKWTWERSKEKRIEEMGLRMREWIKQSAPRMNLVAVGEIYKNVPLGHEERIAEAWKPYYEMKAECEAIKAEVYVKPEKF